MPPRRRNQGRRRPRPPRETTGLTPTNYREVISDPWGPTPAPAPPTTNGLPPDQQSAFDMLRSWLTNYGLDSLVPVLEGIVRRGVTDPAQVELELRDTNEWKQRFAGNEMLRQAGGPVLSVAEYLAEERAYRTIMQQYGLPAGFYDDPADFAQWIGKGVSPNELNERVSAWADLSNRQDPAIKDQLMKMGMNEGDLLAFMMDPSRATSLIQQKYKETLVGAAALRTGLNSNRAAEFAAAGITEQQAIQGYSTISENLETFQTAGSIYGEEYGQADMENEVFSGDGRATQKRKRLASNERAAFTGSSGVGQGSLANRRSGQY